MVDTVKRNPTRVAGPRLVALVGPFQSGKTTLLESLLARTGTLSRQGSVKDSTSVGDASIEARSHAMSVEANVASAEYLGDRITFVDCPGSIEFLNDMRFALPLCDAAIVVCEADERKLPALQLILREVEDLNIPRFLFINKIDTATLRVRETLAMLQPASRTPLLLRQIPLWQNGIATGFIDLALERAFVYREHAPSTVIDVPAGELPREKEARYSMLEQLADYDDALMEELLDDIEPPRDHIFNDLAQDLRQGFLVPLLFGSAERGNGVTRLLKALRHEAPGIAATRDRLGVTAEGPPLARVIRTVHTPHGGKLSLARVLRGSFADGGVVASRSGEDRIAGVSRLMGSAVSRMPRVDEGDTGAFGRLENATTGDTFVDARVASSAHAIDIVRPNVAPPLHAIAISTRDRKDEVRLTTAIAKLIDEDPSLAFVQDQENGEMKLLGQGEMHLRIALERLAGRFGVVVEARRPSIAYRETIRDNVKVRGRHRKQSGGHGQFGDVVIDVAPLARGDGFRFAESVHGGAVPKQYFSSVEAGCEDALSRGPLGFRVVDVAVTLLDGSYHTVDSSDMAFRAAAKIAMHEALAKARPVLLEPIQSVTISIPTDSMSKVSAIVSARRGQILGYDARRGWDGWDDLRALIPESEMNDLIVELRSATLGVGWFSAQFDHLAELAGKAANDIVTLAAHARGNGH